MCAIFGEVLHVYLCTVGLCSVTVSTKPFARSHKPVTAVCGESGRNQSNVDGLNPTGNFVSEG